jgi:hypothetical protein
MLKANAFTRLEIPRSWLYGQKDLVDDINYILIYCEFRMIFEL